jgi:adenylate cyclase
MNGDAGIRSRVDALIRSEERSAEIGAGVVRIIAGLVLAAVLAAAGATMPVSEWAALTRYRTAMLVIAAFIASGVFGIALARSRFYRRQLAHGFIALDAVLVGVFLHRNLVISGLPGDFVAASPVAWLLPLLLAVAVLRFRPGVQLFALAAYATAIVAVVAASASADAEGR